MFSTKRVMKLTICTHVFKSWHDGLPLGKICINENKRLQTSNCDDDKDCSKYKLRIVFARKPNHSARGLIDGAKRQWRHIFKRGVMLHVTNRHSLSTRSQRNEMKGQCVLVVRRSHIWFTVTSVRNLSRNFVSHYRQCHS